MNNDSLIFTDNNTQQFNRFAKRILTARILIFILAAICLFMAGIGFFLEPQHVGEEEDAIVLLVFFGGMCLIYLTCGIVSYRKPLTAFIIATTLTLLFLTLFINFALSGLQYDSNTEISVYCITSVLILAFVFFIVRGGVFAKRRKTMASFLQKN